MCWYKLILISFYTLFIHEIQLMRFVHRKLISILDRMHFLMWIPTQIFLLAHWMQFFCITSFRQINKKMNNRNWINWMCVVMKEDEKFTLLSIAASFWRKFKFINYTDSMPITEGISYSYYIYIWYEAVKCASWMSIFI